MLIMETALQSENYSLRQQLESLLKEARLNEDKMRRFDQLEHQLIGAHSLVDLIHLLLSDYKQAFAIEFVSLALVDREYEAERILATEKDKEQAAHAFPGLIFVQSPALLEEIYGEQPQPVLAAFNPRLHTTLFHTGGKQIESIALLPLIRQGHLIGSLHLGSTNAQRYSSDAGTAFLERLGHIIAICLETALAKERLKLVGLTDGLTGVQNRRYFEHRCPIEVSQAKRQQQSLACMFLDIDKFKRINDTYGHPTGDEILRDVAAIIQTQLRASDTISRYGGEEFVVLLPQTAGQHAQEIAERIRSAIANKNFLACNKEQVAVTISIGLSMLPHNTGCSDIKLLAINLIASADKALYQAKHSGRNRVVSEGIAGTARQTAAIDWRKPASWLPGGLSWLSQLVPPEISKLWALAHKPLAR
jgi:diguanylate cyclase (GGDEF)-like protein